MNVPRIISIGLFLCGLTALLSIVLGTSTTPSQTQSGYVDLDKVSRLAKPIQQIINKVEETVRPHKEEAEKKMEQLDILRVTYEQQKSILSEEQRKTRQQEIAKLQDEITTLSENINQLLRKMEDEQLNPAYEIMMESVKKVAQRKGLKLVLSRDAIIWADSSLDITDDVIADLNNMKQLPAARPASERTQTKTQDTITTGTW